MNSLLEHCCRFALLGLTDRELLDAVVIRRDEAAFTALVRRHGPMVLGVCRRLLGNHHDAEDAFQATFLVLLRKAAAIRKREALGSWLYGVACRTARKARVLSARRAAKEKRAASRAPAENSERDFGLDEELNALPEKYRVPVVLCELEGRSRKEVARQLGVPEGTLSSRLAAARKLLAQRLRRRGWTFSNGVPPAVGVPAAVVSATAKAGGLVLAGRGISGVVSAQVLTLSEGVVRAMVVSKSKALVATLVVLGSLGVGVGRLPHSGLSDAAVASAQEPRPGSAEPAERAAADLEAARAAVKVAEANLVAARAQLVQKEADYENARRRASGPDEKAESAIARAIAHRFKYRVPVEIGWTQSNEGGRIEIQEVRGTRPRIEVGGQYLVRGKYTLPPGERGRLYFYETAEGAWGLTPTTDMDCQTTTLDKQQGEFTLLHGMAGPGYFHLYLASPDKYSRYFANVYFGTGDNVLRKEP
jgi:RNA polymerase sigma factor (sigma-70 family)